MARDSDYVEGDYRVVSDTGRDTDTDFDDDFAAVSPPADRAVARWDYHNKQLDLYRHDDVPIHTAAFVGGGAVAGFAFGQRYGQPKVGAALGALAGAVASDLLERMGWV